MGQVAWNALRHQTLPKAACFKMVIVRKHLVRAFLLSGGRDLGRARAVLAHRASHRQAANAPRISRCSKSFSAAAAVACGLVRPIAISSPIASVSIRTAFMPAPTRANG